MKEILSDKAPRIPLDKTERQFILPGFQDFLGLDGGVERVRNLIDEKVLSCVELVNKARRHISLNKTALCEILRELRIEGIYIFLVFDPYILANGYLSQIESEGRVIGYKLEISLPDWKRDIAELEIDANKTLCHELFHLADASFEGCLPNAYIYNGKEDPEVMAENYAQLMVGKMLTNPARKILIIDES